MYTLPRLRSLSVHLQLDASAIPKSESCYTWYPYTSLFLSLGASPGSAESDQQISVAFRTASLDLCFGSAILAASRRMPDAGEHLKSKLVTLCCGITGLFATVCRLDRVSINYCAVRMWSWCGKWTAFCFQPRVRNWSKITQLVS